MRCDCHYYSIVRTLLFLSVVSFLGQPPLGISASPVQKATSMNLASIPSTTATTCPFKDATLPNHSGSTNSSSKQASVKTKDQHEKRARSLKLYRLECFEKLVDAVQDPAKTVIPGPTSFSYLGGLDMTPDPETAEAWGLYELQLREILDLSSSL
ncbi:hypothetical protein GGU10DRAFT_364803 [Lentinula aff. detonsa]|uniref:Uncharacterized protein n=1 Tax=Lentinula aff. detonsa TaxID=2804958 RepID=A0AA38KUF6_9AGAR|nr:hypothetical protein GGU10DRAFT_364803 [Lentinula aff. detonsa]